MSRAHVTTLGLILDIFGVWWLYLYGLPADVNRQGSTGLTGFGDKPDQNEIRKAERYDKRARIALWLFGTGLFYKS